MTMSQPRVSDSGSAWTSLVDGSLPRRPRPPLPSAGRVVGRFVLANLIAVALLLAASIWASQQAARDEAIADARHATDLLATLVVEPNLREGLLTGSTSAVDHLDAVLRDRLAAASVIRVKIWTPDGRIVYSDEPRLIGAHFPLSEDDVLTLRDGETRAELSDLSRPENQFEPSAGKLLEVYRQIRTPAGDLVLLETYSPYREATARQMDIWLRIAPISATVLLVLLAMQLPLASRMVSQLRTAEREREVLQARAMDASTEERRRIAGSLHDGIVQDVSASSLLVAGAADQLRDTSGRRPAQDLGEVLDQAATALRDSVGSLRSLLVEIYPPHLERAGLFPALADLANRLRPRGIEVRMDVPEQAVIPLDTATLVFRTAQEALLNVAKHAAARVVELTVTERPDRLVLEISDDGSGFDLAATLHRPCRGHLGLDVLTDLAEAAGACLWVRTAPGAGTRLRLEVPRR